MKYKQFIYQVLSVSIGLYASNSIAQSVNKCTINGKVTYQSTPCPAAAKAKAVDTTDKNAALGKEFAKSAKADKEKLAEREKTAVQTSGAAQRKSENWREAEMAPPVMRNLAIERIEDAAKKLK
jgi:hypothetical protein